MPLAFDSLSHGRVAFGFFNIEVDLLLLERYFFTAEEFCDWVAALAGSREETARVRGAAFFIENPLDIGDLHAAIAGRPGPGFLGDVYRLFPFPDEPAGFHQKPYGQRNRAAVRPLLERYARPAELPILVDEEDQVHFGPIVFKQTRFLELVRYVWLGGYPLWKEDERPPYLQRFRANLEGGRNPLFHDLNLDAPPPWG